MFMNTSCVKHEKRCVFCGLSGEYATNSTAFSAYKRGMPAHNERGCFKNSRARLQQVVVGAAACA